MGILKKTAIILLSGLFIYGATNAKQTTTSKDYDRIFDKAQYFMDKGQYDNVIKVVSTLSEDEISTANDTVKISYNIYLGKAYYLAYDYVKAERYLDHAISLYEKLLMKYPSYIDILVIRAFASDQLNKRDEAAGWYRKALVKGTILEHNYDLDNCCYLNLGNIYNESGNYILADEYYKKIQWKDPLQKVEIHCDYYGKTSERYLQYASINNWIKAKEINDSLTNYCRVKYGETDDFYLSCLQSEGTIQYSLKDLEKAIIPYDEIIRIGKLYGLKSYYVGYAYCQKIQFYVSLDKMNEAIALLPEAREYIKRLSDNRISEIEPYFYIGMAYVRNMDFNSGIDALEKFMTATPDYMRWGIPYAINKLTWSYLNVGRYQDVLDMLIPILSNKDRLPDDYRRFLPHLHKTIGCAYYLLNKKEDAIYNLKEAIRLSEGAMANDDFIKEILTGYGEL